jgi:hypothetical protein
MDGLFSNRNVCGGRVPAAAFACRADRSRNRAARSPGAPSPEPRLELQEIDIGGL